MTMTYAQTRELILKDNPWLLEECQEEDINLGVFAMYAAQFIPFHKLIVAHYNGKMYHYGTSKPATVLARRRSWSGKVADHGTVTRYYQGCKCQKCTHAASAKTRQWRKAKKENELNARLNFGADNPTKREPDWWYASSNEPLSDLPGDTVKLGGVSTISG